MTAPASTAPHSPPARIVLDPGTVDCTNLGDVAMLQVAIARLAALWPSATIHVFTGDAAALARHCPGVCPVSEGARGEWFADRFFLGRVHRFLPQGASRRLVATKAAVRRRHPALMDSAMRLRTKLHRTGREEMRAFLDVMDRADLIALAGQHALADPFRARARMILEMLEGAVWRGIPTAMFSQAVGPLTDREVRARAREVLPRVGLITVREARTSVPLLEELGVSRSRMLMTGDDAIALAFPAGATASREALGVNLRITPVAGADPSTIDRVRRPLLAFARARDVPLVPLPAAHHAVAADARVLRELLAEYDETSDGGLTIDTTGALIAAVGRCRIVVSGAYHVAVFALAQGIPVVALARSEYYRSKYVGLEDLFGAGCDTVRLDDREFETHLREAMERAWTHADALRPRLLEAAERQVRASEAAYARFATMVNAGGSSR